MKKSLIILILILLAGCSSPLAGADKKAEWEKADSPLKLKAIKENILKEKIVDDIRCDVNTFECVNYGEIKQYDYKAKTITSLTVKETKGKTFSNVAFVKEEKGELTERFFPGDVFWYDDKDSKWKDIGMDATTTIEAFEAQTKDTKIEKIVSFIIRKVIATDLGPEYSSDDNSLYTDNEGALDWDAHRDDDTADAARGGSAGYTECFKRPSGYLIERLFFNFDTSSIGAGASITSANFKVHSSTSYSGNTDTQAITGSTAQDTIDATDFDQFNDTLYSDTTITLSAFATNGYNTFGFNTAGKNAISLTGKTKIVLRNKNYDIDDTAPTDTRQRYVVIQMVETALATSDPYIEVTYTPGVASTQAPRQEEVMWFN